MINRPNLDSSIDHADASTAATSSSRGGYNVFRKCISILLFSAALLIPCFWQSRIQAADLSSHVYNAWLATQIRQGAAPGLWISTQSNNVLFDLMLQWLFARVGPDFAQRLAVAASVLVFGWGAVVFIFRAGGEHWWFAAPCVSILAHGFIFHMGFFNFYLSMGLSLWFLAIFWDSSWGIRVIAVPLLALAWLAHPFPVLWAVGTAAYIAGANTFRPRRRFLALIFGLAVLLDIRYILTHRYSYYWSPRQFLFVTGASEIILFGAKYLIPCACLLTVWALLLRKLLKRNKGVIATIPFQLWVLNAAAVFLIPNTVRLPQYGVPFGFIAHRLSLGAILMLCAVLVAVPIRKIERIVLASVTVAFFGLLYSDDRRLNRLEDRIDAVIASLPSGERVISSLPALSLHSFCFHHDVDRACIGHCFSYANYEPSSRQFRIRAVPGNGIVMDDQEDVAAVERGVYVVRPRDLPVYMVYECGVQSVCSRPLRAGEVDMGAY